METEFEAKFYPAFDDIRERLQKLDATLLCKERLMKRVLFDQRKNPHLTAHYIRVRDEGDKITMSAKIHALEGGNLSDQKEAVTEIHDFDSAVEVLKHSGLIQSSYQENKRETWIFDGAEIVIDTWPGLESYIEVEADSEEKVREIAEKLGYNWKDRRITSVTDIYMEVYDLSEAEVLKMTANITFENNPFDKLKKKND